MAATYYNSAQANKSQPAGTEKASYPVPEYGGDCALSAPGLSSSLSRLSQRAHEVSEMASELANIFAVCAPNNSANKDGSTSASPSDSVDSASDKLASAMSDLAAVLNHIRS